MTLLIVVACIVGYLAVFGLSTGFLDEQFDNGDAALVSGLFWPISMPIILSHMLGRAIAGWFK